MTRPSRAAGLVVHYMGDHDDLMKLIYFVRHVLRVEPLKGSRLLVVFDEQLRAGTDELGDAVKRSIEAFRNVTKVEWIEAVFNDLPHSVREEINNAILALAEKIRMSTDELPHDAIDGASVAGLRLRTHVANELRKAAYKLAWERTE